MPSRMPPTIVRRMREPPATLPAPTRCPRIPRRTPLRPRPPVVGRRGPARSSPGSDSPSRSRRAAASDPPGGRGPPYPPAPARPPPPARGSRDAALGRQPADAELRRGPRLAAESGAVTLLAARRALPVVLERGAEALPVFPRAVVAGEVFRTTDGRGVFRTLLEPV